MTQAAYSNSPVRPVQLVMFRLAVLLALAATTRAAVTNEYSSREDYAAKNNVELAATLVPATTPEFCKTGSAFFMPDTGKGAGSRVVHGDGRQGGGTGGGGAALSGGGWRRLICAVMPCSPA